MTERLGFHRTEGEFKVMGMAAYRDKNKYDFSKLIEFDNDSYSINKNIYSSIGSKVVFEFSIIKTSLTVWESQRRFQ